MKKILEKSGNFVRGKKWELCTNKALFRFIVQPYLNKFP